MERTPDPPSGRFGAKPSTSSTSRGMTFMLLSALAATAMNASVHHMTGEMDPLQIAFFRALFGLLVLAPVFVRHGWEPLRTRRLGLHALRGLLNAGAMILFFIGLGLIPLAKFAALAFSAPLFVALSALAFLGERIRLRRVGALVFGYSGTLLILRPDAGALDLGSLIVLGGAVSWALAMIVMKVLARTDSSLTATLYYGVFVTPVAFLAALAAWQTPTGWQWLWLVAIGALGSLFQFCLSQALKEAEATAVMPLDFTKLIWATVIGYVVFAEVPTAWTWAGGVMIFAAATYISYRERRIEAARASG
jgi:drug/metabolite transporter (DMT)-like permease